MDRLYPLLQLKEHHTNESLWKRVYNCNTPCLYAGNFVVYDFVKYDAELSRFSDATPFFRGSCRESSAHP